MLLCCKLCLARRDRPVIYKCYFVAGYIQPDETVPRYTSVTLLQAIFSQARPSHHIQVLLCCRLYSARRDRLIIYKCYFVAGYIQLGETVPSYTSVTLLQAVFSLARSSRHIQVLLCCRLYSAQRDRPVIYTCYFVAGCIQHGETVPVYVS